MNACRNEQALWAPAAGPIGGWGWGSKGHRLDKPPDTRLPLPAICGLAWGGSSSGGRPQGGTRLHRLRSVEGEGEPPAPRDWRGG